MARTYLPVINESKGGGCGCSTHHDSDHDVKVRQLQEELQQVVATSHARIREGQPAPGPAHAAPTPRAGADTSSFVLSREEPLPLVSEITCHHLRGKHMWVGVRRASLAVFNDAEHGVMELLTTGLTPRAATQRIAAERGQSEAAAWALVSRVIGQIAQNGFLEPIQGYTEVKTSYPGRFARFHLTKACQLECIHCYADSSPHVDRSNELSTERWMQLARDFRANGGEKVLYTGGEALIHKGCVPIMRLSKEIGLYLTLFTNGLLVPRYIDVIQELCDQVQVSLDGPDAPTNDIIRGKGTYGKILHAVDLLAERRVPVRIGMTVMLENWAAWKEQFLAFASRFDGTSVEFKLSFGITPYGRAKDMGSIPVEEVRPVAQAFMEKMNGATGPKITRVIPGCGYGDQLVIGPDGTVYPCHLLDAPLCHVDDRTVPDVIGLLRQVSGMFDVDHVEGCNTCDIRYLCGGMCRVVQGGVTGSRLVTMCTADEKARKLGNLVDTYAQQSA